MSPRFFFADLSIRTKLTALSVLASASALLMACAAFLAYDFVTFREGLVRRLTTQVEMVAFNSASAVIFRDQDSARRTLDAFGAEPQILAAAIYAADGSLFAVYSASPPAAPAFEPLRGEPAYGHQFDGDALSVLHPIVLDGDRVGSVAIRASLEELRQRARRYLGIALVVLIASLGVGYLISSWPKRQISRPILDLVETAHLVAERRDYSLRAPAHGRDELGRLVETFNEMLGQIERRSQELQQARDAALESARLKSAFLANMSHEIRTPLNIILGYNTLIADAIERGGDADQLAIIEAIRRASARLIDTIHGILDISKIESRTFEVKPIPIELAPLVQRHVQDLEPAAAKQGLRLSCEIQEPAAVVLFDPYCLSHALVNLLQNAIKFTEKGEVVVTLYRDFEGCLAIDVRDTGIGIEADYLPKLFEPFSQADSGYSRQFEGSGLGLALTRRYLDLNDAEVSVRSRTGEGSVFTISFSRRTEIAAPAEVAGDGGPPVETEAGASPAETMPRPRVLVVEDHPDTRAYMRTLLDPHYEVLEASCGDEVHRQLAAHPDVRVILMDLSLRGEEDGLMITRDLRQQERWKDVPIIATTAHAFPEDRVRALAAGCDSFLAKPINHKALLSVMSALLH